MHKTFGLVFASAIAAATFCSSTQALPVATSGIRSGTPNITLVWDNCGVGYHRNVYGQCVSNYLHDSRGCPPGYHLGYQVHRCVPNP